MPFRLQFADGLVRAERGLGRRRARRATAPSSMRQAMHHCGRTRAQLEPVFEPPTPQQRAELNKRRRKKATPVLLCCCCALFGILLDVVIMYRLVIAAAARAAAPAAAAHDAADAAAAAQWAAAADLAAAQLPTDAAGDDGHRVRGRLLRDLQRDVGDRELRRHCGGLLGRLWEQRVH